MTRLLYRTIVGRGAWFPVGRRRHHPALFVGVVGRSSDAKGDGWADAIWPFREADDRWASLCIANGVGSGEGLIERIADEQTVMGRDGKAQVIPGASDKRCLVRLSELSRCFKVGRRDSSTLSEYLREAWDGEPIAVPNRKANSLTSTGYAVSLLGDITPGVISKLLQTGTEAVDGFANRFLWVAARGGADLDDGGDGKVLQPFLQPLADALAFGMEAGEMRRDDEAKAVWSAAYGGLRRSADAVPHTDRARPYAVRLSMIYALADRSAVIRAEHLRAGLAVWDFCRQSARVLFGEVPAEPGPSPEPTWLKLLGLIQSRPGIARSELLRACRRADAGRLDEVLARLAAEGMAFSTRQQHDGGGRPAECWWPGQQIGMGMCMMDDNPPLLPPALEAVGKEGNNLALAEEAKLLPVGEGKEGNNLGQAGFVPSDGKEGNNLQPPAEFIPSFPMQLEKQEAQAEEIIPSFPITSTKEPAVAREEGEEEVVIMSADREAERAKLEEDFLENLDRS